WREWMWSSSELGMGIVDGVDPDCALAHEIWASRICTMAHESWFPRASETGLASARPACIMSGDLQSWEDLGFELQMR
ncbi:hypothetical protein PanWU01x14_369970, partial [Parasponia andersonii]